MDTLKVARAAVTGIAIGIGLATGFLLGDHLADSKGIVSLLVIPLVAGVVAWAFSLRLNGSSPKKPSSQCLSRSHLPALSIFATQELIRRLMVGEPQVSGIPE